MTMVVETPLLGLSLPLAAVSPSLAALSRHFRSEVGDGGASSVCVLMHGSDMALQGPDSPAMF